jgi:L-amino acid N-acyltransferase YncA
MEVRPARSDDADAIARIFNQGIAERVATFETQEKTADDFRALIDSGVLLLVATEDERVVAFAKVGPYDDAHDYYAGVGEATLYVDPAARRAGTGRALLDALANEAEPRGLHKLVGKIFTSNRASIDLVHACGWTDVGVHRRHGRLDGEWKDVLVVERLIGVADDRQA